MTDRNANGGNNLNCVSAFGGGPRLHSRVLVRLEGEHDVVAKSEAGLQLLAHVHDGRCKFGVPQPDCWKKKSVMKPIPQQYQIFFADIFGYCETGNQN